MKLQIIHNIHKSRWYFKLSVYWSVNMSATFYPRAYPKCDNNDTCYFWSANCSIMKYIRCRYSVSGFLCLINFHLERQQLRIFHWYRTAKIFWRPVSIHECVIATGIFTISSYQKIAYFERVFGTCFMRLTHVLETVDHSTLGSMKKRSIGSFKMRKGCWKMLLEGVHRVCYTIGWTVLQWLNRALIF